MLKTGGLLQGTDLECHQQFIEHFSQNLEWIEYYFEEYPVLFFRVELFLQAQFAYISEFLSNLDSDLPELLKVNLVISKQLDKIDLFLGDFHNGNKATLFLYFGTKKLLYKPHSLATDAYFYDLVEQVFPALLTPIKYFLQKDYGYSEFIEALPFDKVEDVAAHYYKFGKITSLFMLLGTIDILGENVIAAANQPFFIDLEMLLASVKRKTANPDIYEKIFTFFKNSLLTSSILPDELTWGHFKTSPLLKTVPNESDISTYVLDNYTHEKIAEIRQKMAILNAKFATNLHLPNLNGEQQEVFTYLNDFVTGFQQGCEVLKSYDTDLISNNLPILQVRTMLRSTFHYDRLLKESNKPHYSKSARKYYQLIKTGMFISNRKRQKLIYAQEVLQILQGDIPYFYFYSNDKSLWTATKPLIANFYFDTAQESIKIRKNNFEELQHNSLQLIKQTLLHSQDFTKGKDKIFHNFLNNSIAKGNNAANIANHISQEICNAAFKLSEQKQTYFLFGDVAFNKNSEECVFTYQKAESYNGITGMAIYFLCHYIVSKEKQNLVFFDNILQYSELICKQIFRSQNTEIVPPTWFENPTAHLYLLLLVNKYLGGKLDANFIKKYQTWFLINLQKDKLVDILGGAGGSITLILKNKHFFDTDFITKIIAIYTESLQKGKITLENGQIAWFFDDKLSDKLFSFSHGASGFLFILSVLYKHTKNLDYKNWFLSTFSYILSLYDLEHKSWKSAVNDANFAYPGYNHGCTGFALALLYAEDILEENIIVEQLNRCLWEIAERSHDRNYTLANGIIGNLVISKQIVSKYGNELNPEYVENFKNYLNNITLQEIFIRTGGINSFLTFDLFTGMSGLGYGLLKLFAKEELPNVLAFEV